MFEDCQQGGENGAARCADVAEKLAQLFGWRQTYKVEKLQRSLSNPPGKRREKPMLLHVGGNEISAKEKKGGDAWVLVHSLQSHADGGILDPDDRLNDVADDREQIIANYEDGDGQHHHHGGGDGASGSSVGTGSPDIFQGESQQYYARTDIEVTGEQIASGLIMAPLQVRRGSEPSLNQLLLGGGGNAAGSRVSSAAPGVGNGQHWSAAPAITVEPEDHKEKRMFKKDGRAGRHTVNHNGYSSGDWYQPNGHEPDGPRFARDGSNRLSMQFLSEGTGYRWQDAAERAANTNNRTASKSLPRDHRRKEPLGQANSASLSQSENLLVQDSDIDDELNSDSVEHVVISNETGPLGIHVVPEYDRLGKDRGLLVQGIEPGGRIDRDGRLAVYDRIIEINGSNLLNMPFHRVQEIFKDSLRSAELQLRVVKHRIDCDDRFKKPPAPVFPRSLSRSTEEKENAAMVEGEERLVSHKVATVSPTRKASPGHHATRNSVLSANTRKIGRKIELELVKGPHGLGFSITTRDNPAGGNCPIYIKNILTKGAAVEDGRLRPGDRLLEVNSVEMTGKPQSDAVAVLRNAPPGSRVRIVVSRQEESSSPKLPRQITADAADRSPAPANTSDRLIGEPRVTDAARSTRVEPPDKVNDDGLVFPWKHREILTFDIPVHDTEKAGLGVSVKGKTSANHSLNHSSGSVGSMTSVDLGIFVKAVLHGGAASRDGRLRTNDQLLNVNGISLLAQPNSDAMETLRRAMLGTEGPVPGVITITVARRANGPTSPPPPPTINGTKESETVCTPDNSGTSENSDTTVIFLPCKSLETSRDSSDSYKPAKPGGYEMVGPRNPVLDRLTGQLPRDNAMRNESYYRATNDAWNATVRLSGHAGSPTVNMPPPEMVLIEEEYHRPTGKEEKPVDPTYTSQLSLEEAAGFSRDAFGRQSMSEKRHATLDAKHTDTYQRNKKIREERDKFRHGTQQVQPQQLHHSHNASEGRLLRANSTESISSMAPSYADSQQSDLRARIHEFGPSLGMKKSSSLESLQTMVQEIQMQDDSDPAYTYRNAAGAVRVIRGRGCNESFRAAVDRSYEAPLTDVRARLEMETLAEEDGDLGSLPGFANVRGGPRQSSMNAVLDKNKMGKKKPGLFRGIGSMFRFGKHRKPPGVSEGLSGGSGEEEGWGRLTEEREAARKAAQDEQQRIQEQYRRLMLRQKQMQQAEMTNGVPEPFHREGSIHAPPPGHHRDGPGIAPPQSHHRVGSVNAPPPSHHRDGSVIAPPQSHHRDGSISSKTHHREGSTSSSSIHIGSTHGTNHRDGTSTTHIAHTGQWEPTSSTGIQSKHSAPPTKTSAPSTQSSSNQSQAKSHIGPPPQSSITHIGYNNNNNNNRMRENNREGMSWDREGSGSSSSSQPGQGVYRESGQMGPPPPPPPHDNQTRTERIHQLRAQHQRMHAERRGQYPLEEREEKYEQVIRQRLEQPEVIPGRPTPYDLYGEMSRPGSRVGITDPQRFSHYVNYEEIQVHLNRRQQHYHSQRRDNREPNQRPVSNFYEYESVQALMRANQRSVDDNANSLPRRVNGGINAETNKRTQGPFVTQVMIGQSQPPGSKV